MASGHFFDAFQGLSSMQILPLCSMHTLNEFHFLFAEYILLHLFNNYSLVVQNVLSPVLNVADILGALKDKVLVFLRVTLSIDTQTLKCLIPKSAKNNKTVNRREYNLPQGCIGVAFFRR